MEQENHKIIILTAPSGAGKSSIAAFLLKKYPWLTFSISATTRAPRGKEQNGKEYYFLSANDFRQKIKDNDFLEWEMVYADNYYGTLKSEMDRIWHNQQIPILDIDVKGAIHVMQLYPNETMTIFINPPSMEILESRLRKRATETEEKIQTRLSKASYEISMRNSFQHVILNDDFEKACQEVEKRICAFVGIEN